MTSTSTRAASLAALAGCAALALSACGSSAADTGGQPEGQFANPNGQAGAARFPGASGKIASVADSSFLVQSETAQTRVTYTTSTPVTQTRTIALGEVAVGDCIVANGSETSSDALSAQFVSITRAVDGECQSDLPAGGGTGPGGGRPNGMPSAPPEGGSRPSAPPGAGPGGASFTTAVGKVTSTGSDQLVITGELARASSGDPTSSTGSITVSLAANGQVTRQVSASPAVITVGQCARAIGSADDKGVVAATSINVSAPVNGECRSRPAGAGSPS